MKAIGIVLSVFIALALLAPLYGQIGLRVSPAEVRADNVELGRKHEVTTLAITNTGEKAHTYAISAHEALTYREGYEKFPDPKWVSFDRTEVTIQPGGAERVKVFLKVPNKREWLGQRWETWIQVTGSTAAGETIAVEAFVRVLMSTSGTAPSRQVPIAGIAAVALIILGVIGYYYRRKRRTV